jgi:hypothetical protein
MWRPLSYRKVHLVLFHAIIGSVHGVTYHEKKERKRNSPLMRRKRRINGSNMEDRLELYHVQRFELVKFVGYLGVCHDFLFFFVA